MAKYRDVNGMGKSAIVPRIKGEPPQHRHRRRLLVNAQEGWVPVLAWCRAQGVTVTRHNEWHHWKFVYGKRVAEWWPSSAKLVFDKLWQRGVHTHDYQKVIQALAKRWKLEVRVE